MPVLADLTVCSCISTLDGPIVIVHFDASPSAWAEANGRRRYEKALLAFSRNDEGIVRRQEERPSL
jgi:hypothetical protein